MDHAGVFVEGIQIAAVVMVVGGLITAVYRLELGAKFGSLARASRGYSS
jgi:hypothetical protein